MVSAAHRRAVAAAMTAAMVAVSCLALLVASGSSARRTVLAEGDMFDASLNPSLGCVAGAEQGGGWQDRAVVGRVVGKVGRQLAG